MSEHIHNVHLYDEELLLAQEGEVSSRHGRRIRDHLRGCQACRARRAALEDTLAELRDAHREIVDTQVPPISVVRGVLRARLADAAEKQSRAGSWWRFLQFAPVMRGAAIACAIGLLAVTAARFLFPRSVARVSYAQTAEVDDRTAVPDRGLTPGAARTVSLEEICAMAHEEVELDVPDPLRERVFQEYGIANALASEYEIDYLIAPGLGGTEDIHNLWPEPYKLKTWNAHVKDDLEEHLHQLVCAGKLDLPTAQKEIATDWIAAYKKYFHNDRPVAGSVASSASWRKNVELRGQGKARLSVPDSFYIRIPAIKERFRTDDPGCQSLICGGRSHLT